MTSERTYGGRSVSDRAAERRQRFLDAALVADERVRLHYATGDAAVATWRTVDPYGLVSKAGTWYLVAAHRGRPKMYRVSRVRDVARGGQPALKRGGPCASAKGI